MRIIEFLIVTILASAFGTVARGQIESVPNPTFEKGTDAPEGWTLSGGTGKWVDHSVLTVTGNGQDSNYWRSVGYRFEPGVLYHFEMRARRISGAGTVICGPSFANRDFTGVTGDWQKYGFVFRAQENAADGFLRLGQWQLNGTVEFDEVRLVRTMPVHTRIGGIELGEGESIQDGEYVFDGNFHHHGSNFHRTLARATAWFNSNRWAFGADSQVVYCFAVPAYQQASGSLSFAVNYHQQGSIAAEASRDEKDWKPVATLDKSDTAQGTLPGDLFPAERIFVRLRCPGPQADLQVDNIIYRAKLAGRPPQGAGRTDFADILSTSPSLDVERVAVEGPPASGTTAVLVAARNRSQQALRVALTGSVTREGQPSHALAETAQELEPGKTATFRLEAPADQPGRHQVALALKPAAGKPFQTALSYTVPDYYRSDYGRQVVGASSETVGVWWCDATHKVPPEGRLPKEAAPAADVSAAKNDWEAVQIIVRPKSDLKALQAATCRLEGPGGAAIPADHVRILRVVYHDVRQPTDYTGVRGRWPDALPPLTGPVNVPAGENQPLWVLIHVPENARPGDYLGDLTLRAQGWSGKVPIRLHVWDFVLPKRNHLETAFGFSPGEVFRYHGLKSEEDRRRVLDLYFQCFAEHRISPYNPTPMDPIRVTFRPEADPPRADVDFAAFDPAMTRAVETYHFTGYQMPIEGMGGGTFHERWEPKIGRFGEKTPQYQAMFSSYVRQLESHFREKGWLDMAYVYWFDEPEERDYEFVINGMQRLKKYAPGLRRMLTEEVREPLAGAVDIWCPVTPNYDHVAAEKRRAHGERFWWYVCTGPKAPYCTLFIDHPATELRIWVWQTWQRKIDGLLVWQSNYWTSDAAFPDKPQNPYDDPMGYVSGYSTPKGVRRHWGNGDGRFIYPPISAANADNGPVIEPPVSSIRWEMLREGIEDYEYLHLLRDLLGQKRQSLPPEAARKIEALLEVPPAITKDMTVFTTDPATIYAHRAAVAEAIEAISRS